MHEQKTSARRQEQMLGVHTAEGHPITSRSRSTVWGGKYLIWHGSRRYSSVTSLLACLPQAPLKVLAFIMAG
jgi:hypothetical protein